MMRIALFWLSFGNTRPPTAHSAFLVPDVGHLRAPPIVPPIVLSSTQQKG